MRTHRQTLQIFKESLLTSKRCSLKRKDGGFKVGYTDGLDLLWKRSASRHGTSSGKGFYPGTDMKLNGMKKPLQCWEEYKCCVCLKKVETFSQEKWMDLTVCVVSLNSTYTV